VNDKVHDGVNCTKIGTYEWCVCHGWICWNIGSSDEWTSFLNFFLLKEKWPCLTGQTITLRIVASSGPSVMLSIKSPARFIDFRFRAGPTQGSSRPDPTGNRPGGFFVHHAF